jgi:hypothetical protein
MLRAADVPKSVRSRVSFASHTVNQPPCSAASNAVTVRHAPLTAIESPTWQSPRTGAESAMVMVHPASSSRMEDTFPRCSIWWRYESLAVSPLSDLPSR